jgi:hypothetical protein
VKYKAAQYAKINQKRKDNYFIRQELYYQDVELKAGIIVMNYETNEVYAGRIRDPQENIHNIPISSSANEVQPDSIRILRHKSFNMEFKI